MTLKLNLGCGLYKLQGFVNIDVWEDTKPNLVMDIRKLPYENCSVDFIYAGHILEHFYIDEALDVLKEWKRVLKAGGRLVIVVPDFEVVCKRYVEGRYSLDEALPPIYGELFSHNYQLQKHHYAYDFRRLAETVKKVGWVRVERLDFHNPPEEIKPFIGKPWGISPVDWQVGIVLTK